MHHEPHGNESVTPKAQHVCWPCPDQFSLRGRTSILSPSSTKYFFDEICAPSHHSQLQLGLPIALQSLVVDRNVVLAPPLPNTLGPGKIHHPAVEDRPKGLNQRRAYWLR